MTVFCGISPVGIGTGIALKNEYVGRECSFRVYYANIKAEGGAVLLVFQGLATGSLLYVVFFEILEKERVKDVNGFAQAMSMTFGYVFMILLSILEDAKTGHDDGDFAFINGTFVNTTTAAFET